MLVYDHYLLPRLSLVGGYWCWRWWCYSTPVAAWCDCGEHDGWCFLCSWWCWGDGSPLRELLYIDDMAEACYACMENYSDPEIINIGTGYDISIKELTEVIAKVVGYNGDIKWDTTKPNGTPRKVMNVDKLLGLGWKPKVDIVEGLTKTYEWFKENYDRI